jgi:hypothetical protein
MRSFLVKSSLISGIIFIIILISGTALAIYAPLKPGNILFPFQSFAEQQGKSFYYNPVNYSSYMLDLVERRINDLNTRIGSKYELIALEDLDKAIDQATLAISLVPQDKVDSLRTRFDSLAKRANEVQNQLKFVPIEENTVYIAFQSKIKALLQEGTKVATTNYGKHLDPVVTPNPSKDQVSANHSIVVFSSVSGLIPFPPGSQGAVHAFYPLLGKHATQTCNSCHDSGKYVGASKTCIQCHFMKLPNPHYPGACDLCHTAVSWTDIHFDHTSATATDCSSCHQKDTPANHYNGQCSACHISQAWNIVTFDHAVAGATDCISCHTKVAPANHFPGQCSNCHNTLNWTSVVFNHVGLTDCVSCHSKDAPVNHYSGQCSNCHDSNSTWKNAQFNHSGFTDCISCHAGNAPANHYQGQCSNCHDPNSNWQTAHFNHSGFSDCISCHAGNAPANHYPGQCSNCHSTSSWSGAVFNHDGLTDCISCHLKDRPAEHDTGQCSNCHTTQGWGNGGGAGAFSFVNIGILQEINCSVCHSNNVDVSIGKTNQ